MKSAEALNPSQAFLQAHGLAVEPEQLQAMLRFAVSELQQILYPLEPRCDLTVAEADTLARGGLDLSPRAHGEESALAHTAAKYAALLETSLTTAQVAKRLGVDPSRVRQRLTEGTLYGIRSSAGWRLPVFQFDDGVVLPGLGEILPRLNPHLHPVGVYNFFTAQNVDLHVEEVGRCLSPREWLQAGYPPTVVAEIAAGLD